MFIRSISGSRKRIKSALYSMKKRTIYEWIKEAIIILIHLYQHSASLLLGPCCRFTPSCSSYAVAAIQRFGIAEGTRLAFGRLIKCHPFHPGGHDPVPEIIEKY